MRDGLCGRGGFGWGRFVLSRRRRCRRCCVCRWGCSLGEEILLEAELEELEGNHDVVFG